MCDDMPCNKSCLIEMCLGRVEPICVAGWTVLGCMSPVAICADSVCVLDRRMKCDCVLFRECESWHSY